MPTLTAMHMDQQSPATAWALPPGQARCLTIGPGDRWLQICDGTVWLTLPADGSEASQDICLTAGQGLLLPSGCEALLEGWPQARFQLLVPPCSTPSRLMRLSEWIARISAWLRRRPSSSLARAA